ncbi:class I SAM-dependent methyltransferase [Paenibacillus sp. sgz500958]|uniref:class I SAM-dependent methyltransferase n=1 Tax=Paenibacillus sp. sgz500958 TaxID=3242475 RepID=UPI0036D2648D
MIPDGNRKANIDRFLGYPNDYDRYRPEAPQLVTTLLGDYLGARPELVVDVGCGTGLSTFLWSDHADRVIGVEPNPDMRGKALDKLASLQLEGAQLSFIPGYANQLDLPSGSADIVTCSQSFHWMEPVSTLKEISRILRDGGVFAAYDCVWPPALRHTIEERYNHLILKADEVLGRIQPAEEQAQKWNKDEHLSRIRASRAFTFTREIVFHHIELCDAERYIGLALSQGGIQNVLKLGSEELDNDIATFRDAVNQHFQGKTLEVVFSYKMYIGIK